MAGSMGIKICLLYHCNNEISADRLSQGNKTCCQDHRDKNKQNRRAKARAKQIGKEVRICKKCLQYFTGYKAKDCVCYGCKTSKPIVTRGKNEVAYKYDPYAAKDGGGYAEDFRVFICQTFGDICDNYVKCSDNCVAHKKGLFKYQANGGTNCYIKAGDIVNRVNYGNSVGICSVNR